MKHAIYTFTQVLITSLFLLRISPLLGHEYPNEKEITFIKNIKQWEDNIRYKVNLRNGAIFLEDNTITYTFLDNHQLTQFFDQKFNAKKEIRYIRTHAYKVHFRNALPHPNFEEIDPYTHYHNYYIGQDSTHWSSQVPLFKEIKYKNIYKGIDLSYTQAQGSLKYEFIVAPGADPNEIIMDFEGVEKLTLNKGNLEIHTSIGKIQELKPICYQIINNKKLNISGEYILKKNEVRFRIDNYNHNYPLIIDPTLVFSTFTGSTADNWGFTATYDNLGNAYGGGIAFSIGYPTTIGAYETDFSGSVDITISKFNSNGSNLLYSTYLGGMQTEQPHSLVCNHNNELYLFGTTSSNDFPVTAGCFQSQFHGGTNLSLSNSMHYYNGSDIILAKFNADGTQLLSSTFVGGSNNDGLLTSNIPLRKNYADECRGEIILDENSNVFVTSTTTSSDFPTTSQAYLSQHNGRAREAILFKMNHNLTNMIWCTYFGGDGMDAGYSLTLNEDGSIYFCGGTTSENLPTQFPAYQPINPGGTNGFIAQISADGSTLQHCSYLGRPNYDQAYFVKCDKEGFPYVYGQTEDTTQSWVINAQWHQGNGQFITKLHKNLSGVIWSTEFGTLNYGPDISPTALLIDLCDQIYMSGWASPRINGFGGTSGLPITIDAFQNTSDNSDYYFICIGDHASSLEYATFFGSQGTTSQNGDEHVDGGTSRFDRKGRIYQAVCAGCGGRSNFPTTAGAYSRTNGSHNCNLALIKMDFNLPVVVADFQAPTTGCAPINISFVNNSQEIGGSTQYFWDFGDGTTSTAASPTHTYTTSGTYLVTLIAQNASSCNFSDTIQKHILILGNTSFVLDTMYLCNHTAIQIGVPPAPANEITYHWQPNIAINNPNISNPYVTPDTATLYTCYISNGTCYDTLYQWVYPSIVSYNLPTELIFCADSSITIDPQVSAPANTTFQWSTSNHFNNTLNNDPYNPILTYTPTNSTIMLYLKIKTNNCEEVAQILLRQNNVEISLPESITICFDENTQIPLEAQNNYTYQWSPTNEITSDANTAHPWILPTNTSSTFYVTATSEYGCTAIDSIIVIRQMGTFPFNIEAWASENDIFYGDTITLYATQFEDGNSYQYQWEPIAELTNPNMSFTTATPKRSTTFVVEVTDSFGCSQWDTVYVKVTSKKCGEPLIYIPNAFTPNNDGKNDILYVRSEIIESFTFRIYNRWGELIFETQNQEIGWDGKFKGEDCPTGTYDFYFEGICIGENHSTYKTKGNITLIR